MSTQDILYYLHGATVVRVYLDEDGLPDTADAFNPKTGEFEPDPVSAIDSQMGSSGYYSIDEATFNAKLEELRKQAAAT